MSKLKLEFNPYTYTRVQVMRTLLFKKHDYDRLLKLSFTEIADYLAKTTYRKEIDKLALRLSGADLIEHALNLNLKNTFAKIKRIADPDLRKAFDAYLLREDFHTLKVLLRSLASGEPLGEEQLEELTMEIGVLRKSTVEAMRQAKTPFDLLHRSGIVNMQRFKDLTESNTFNLAELETRLDKEYYGKMLAFTKLFTKQGVLFAEFLRNEIDITNILTLARMLHLEKPADDIKKLLIFGGLRFSDSKLLHLAESGSFEQFINAIKKSSYKAAIKDMEFDSESLLFFKTQLLKFLTKRTLRLMHQNPLTVDTIIGFTLLKEQEVKNLKIIVKGKQLGVDEKHIEEGLVL